MERRGDWTYCALAIRHLSNEDAGNYTVSVRNKYGEKSNFVRLSMKDKNEPTKYVNSVQNHFNSLIFKIPNQISRVPGGIEPSFFRKPSSRQEGNKLHLECEIEALPR